MKTLISASLAVAIAVGVTPAAFADTEADVSSDAFARAGLAPVAYDTPRYPARSENALEEGVCTVTFDILPSGSVDNAETRDCTSWDFEREAKRVVASLRYPARSDGAVISDQEITFRWVGDEPAE